MEDEPACDADSGLSICTAVGPRTLGDLACCLVDLRKAWPVLCTSEKRSGGSGVLCLLD